MTGFGRAHGKLESLSLSVELNSVNRRNLEFQLNIPREWQMLEKEMIDRMRKFLDRGKVHGYVQVEPSDENAGLQWDEKELEESLHRLESLARKRDIPWEPSADAIIRLVSLHKTDLVLPDPEVARGVLMKVFEKALSGLVDMREAEGQSLEKDLKGRLESLEKIVTRIRKSSQGSVPRYRDLLFQRLKQAGLELDINDDRVLKELALFADRCDISEELTRLESHFTQFREALEAGQSHPVGRKLEFIVQEINREFNTVGSKANNIEINRDVIEGKNEMERIREQIQNVE